MPPDNPSPAAPDRTNFWLLLIASANLALQVTVTLVSSYGYFIDEFYYIACARRPAFGYVDHPPLAPLVLTLLRPVLGESLLAIRLPAFLAGSTIVWATGRMVLEFGGRRWAALTAAATAGLAPGLLGMTGFFSVNAFEALAWVFCTWRLLRLLATGNPRLWVIVGLLIGLGFESKHTMVTLVMALGVGLLATRARALLWNRWAVLGGAIAAALALPNVIWQVVHGFPSLEFYRQAALLKNLPSPPAHTLIEQLQFMGLLTSPIWLVGLGYMLFARDGACWRALALAYIVLLVMLVVSQQSRPDRLFGIYPVLIAAGAATVERVVRSHAARAGITVALLAGCLPGVPIVIGVLPPPTLARYVAWLGLQTSGERGKTSPIPQLLADRTGWEAFVAQVAQIYRTLPPAEAHKALVYAPSYGQAGAVDLLGKRDGLPRAISGQNSYYHWSETEGVNCDALIAVGSRLDDLRLLFRHVERVDTTQCTYCMNWRDGMPIYLARGSIRPVSSIWPKARHYE
jgi:4-amino-4-deoxy-L-arabinose transferase-like glycosyltransferase